MNLNELFNMNGKVALITGGGLRGFAELRGLEMGIERRLF
jgi:hypothetical protein